MQQSASLFSADLTGRMVERLEPTVPLFHEAVPAQVLSSGPLQEPHQLGRPSSYPIFSGGPGGAQGVVMQGRSPAAGPSTRQAATAPGTPLSSSPKLSGGTSWPIGVSAAAQHQHVPGTGGWQTAPLPSGLAEQPHVPMRRHPIEEEEEDEPQMLGSPHDRSRSVQAARVAVPVPPTLVKSPSAAQLQEPHTSSPVLRYSSCHGF
jgi:hypothetical protein